MASYVVYVLIPVVDGFAQVLNGLILVASRGRHTGEPCQGNIPDWALVNFSMISSRS